MRGVSAVAGRDVGSTYEKAKHVHLSRHRRGRSECGRGLLRVLADNQGKRAGELYDAFEAETDLGYTRYSELIKKLEQLGLVEAEYADVEGRGRSRAFSLAYDADAVLERLE